MKKNIPLRAFFLFSTLAVSALYFTGCEPAKSSPAIYGNVSKFNYLTGRFNPSKHPDFINLKKAGIPVDRKVHFLRKRTAIALKKMIHAFEKDHPGVKIWVRSSTRNFFDQKYIWEKKWRSGKYGNKNDMPLTIARNILKYSSMPGTSRHHWGTDFDINNLTNSYFRQGEGKIIYGWLRKNAAKYGFCQPYTAGRKKGYNEERWHWSYLPLSRKFLEGWNSLYAKKKDLFTGKGGFLGSESAGGLAPVYVNSINSRCR
jgi:LAS superfamily LD-carboxypeptidase LdcB